MKVNGWDNATSSLGLHCVLLAGASGMEASNGGGKKRLKHLKIRPCDKRNRFNAEFRL